MIDRVPRDDESEQTAEERPQGGSENSVGEAAERQAHERGGKPVSHDIIDLSNQKEASETSEGDKGKDGEKCASDGNTSKGDREKPQGKPKATTKDDNPPKPPPKSVFLVVGLVLLAALAWGGYEHWRSYSASKQTTDDTVGRPIEVRTAEAKKLDEPIDLTLPGETQAFATANIYARATGYITERRVDIGSRVKEGELLVHIASPDVDQQLAQAQAQIGQTQAALVQAQAQVTQSEANVNLAKVNFARTDQLTQQGYASQQNRDQRQADVDTQQANLASTKAGVRVAEANVKAQQATIDRLTALAAFEDVRAPFDGVVTARNVDKGDLINADTGSGTPMFTMVRDATIRVIVRVPQSAAEGIHQGLEAKVVVPQMPGRSFSGRVQRNSVALLYSSRTLTTEVDVPNETGDLRPGLYVTVSFAVPRDQTDVNVPAEALMFDQHGLRVASVENDLIKLNKVNIYRDHGTTVDLREGLKGGERIVLNPAATLKDGAKVKEIREEDEKKKDEEDKANNAKTSGKDADTKSSDRQAKADDGKNGK